MTDFYTDVSLFKNKILLRGYDAHDKRIQQEIPYRPYLFVPSKDSSEYQTVRGQNVSKIEFDSIYDAKDFIKKYKDVSNFNIYGMDKFVYPYISDNFRGTINYRIPTIKVMYLDIEVDTSDGFPDLETANRHITAITIRIGNTRTVFGLKDFDKSKMSRIKDIENVIYYKFRDEKALLRAFVNLWIASDVDVITGWNIDFFDIPYIVKRLRVVFDEETARSLSPWGRLIERTIEVRGKEQQVFYPVGIAILDYMQLYKKFTYSQRESYSLNYISHVELGVAKMDYSDYENLNDLYEKNHQLYIEYNIIDTDLIHDLELKLRLIELIFAIAYDAKVNYTDALGSVLLWDVIIMNYLMAKNIVVDPNRRKPSTRDFEGGYVKAPLPGLHEWVVSFDLQSLYPHLIMQYNISPETFIDRVGNITPENILTGMINKTEKSLASNGCRYTKEKYGFLPALMEMQFKLRSEYKNKMIELKKENAKTPSADLDAEIAKYHNFQLAKKIQLNSLYGSVSNEYFRWYDPQHAEAITLSGQTSIRWIANGINAYMNKLLKTDDVDYIIAIDTDSVYVNFGPLIKELKPKDPISFLDKISKEKIEPFMKKKYDELANNTNAYSNKMFMKREAIADKAIWRAKKNYVMSVWDNEGVRYKTPDIKMMGIEAIRSSTPEVCRNKIKETIRLILSTDEETVRSFVLKFRDDYKSLPFEDIAFPRSVKNLSKYIDTSNIYKLGTPVHTKASIIYNNMIKKHKLTKKYSSIYDMDKIKWAYLIQPNPTHDTVIAAPTILPKEFGLQKYIDYDFMFEKSFLEPIKSFLNVIGWEIEKTSTLDEFFS